MACTWDKVELGTTGLRISQTGLGSSHGIGKSDVVRAFDRGVNYFYWDSLRRASFGRGVSELARTHRDEMVVCVQSYTRTASLLRFSLARALKNFRLNHADLLLLGMWNDVPPHRIVEKVKALVADGLVRHVMVSCHHRPTFQRHIADPTWAALADRTSKVVWMSYPRVAVRPEHLGTGRSSISTARPTGWARRRR